MKNGFDISRIQDDGYLIMPLSMSRLSKGQTPEYCYTVLKSFLKKLETFSNDVIVLYTNGLYFNSDSISYENRKKTNQQLLNHASALRALIEKKKEFIPGAIHYLPIDYVMLNAPKYKEFFEKLKKYVVSDEGFHEALVYDAKDGIDTEANINFLLEEIVVAHILRQRLVELPRTLVRNDIWRLVAYPGRPLHSDVYQWKHKLLSQSDLINPFAGAQYDLEAKKLVVFNEI